MFDTHVPDFRVEPFPIHARLNDRSEILFKNMDYLWVVYCEFEVNQYSNLLISSNDFSEIWPYWMYLMFHVRSRFNHPDHSPSPCCVPHWHKPRPEQRDDHKCHFEVMSWRFQNLQGSDSPLKPGASSIRDDRAVVRTASLTHLQFKTHTLQNHQMN